MTGQRLKHRAPCSCGPLAAAPQLLHRPAHRVGGAVMMVDVVISGGSLDRSLSRSLGQFLSHSVPPSCCAAD